jgi:DNA-binding transcriptional LysR family regulator
MEPTAFAERIAPEVRAAVLGLEAALKGAAPFDPGAVTGTLRLSAPDYAIATIFPGFLSRVCHAAPGLSVAVRSYGRDGALRALAEGQADLAIGYFWDLPPAFLAEPLSQEDYLVAARADHPLLAGPLTLEAYLAARHIVVAPQGGTTGIVDRLLLRRGLSRRVVASLPQFLPALALLARSDLLSTMPSRVVRDYGAAFGVGSAPPPLEVRPFVSAAVRHRRDEKNPLVLWAMDELRASLATGAGQQTAEEPRPAL